MNLLKNHLNTKRRYDTVHNEDNKNNECVVAENVETKYEPVVFVNNPISDSKHDVLGFESQIKTIDAAIKSGATMIGIVADYGTGKSSMTELLIHECKRKHIKINMWDCLSKITNDNSTQENVSTLTKSFLFQLSTGVDRGFAGYINKILGKNYGNISFSTDNREKIIKELKPFIILFVIYLILSITGTGITQFLGYWGSFFASFLKVISPIFLVTSIIALFKNIKDIGVAFSYWNMPNKREPEINDVFDVYNKIITKLTHENNDIYLIFIDDLDRIDDKMVIIEFLKELYRFRDSMKEHIGDFVFVVSIKPEFELKEKTYVSEKSDKQDTTGTQDTVKDNVLGSTQDNEKVYSKFFDTIISLKPIHFDDYDSILLGLIKTDKAKMDELSKMLDGFVFEDTLPKEFKWIKKGVNLTLRDLKDRLNQTIALFVSLRNKDYKVKTSVNFESSAAVTFLESQYPKDYYKLIKDEESFATFMKGSYKIVNDSSEEEVVNNLIKLFADKDVFGKDNYGDIFVTDFCSMVASRIFNDDFRMYFYTYPKNSHIKTTEERELCDMLLYPNQKSDFSELDENVQRAYNNEKNDIIKETLKSLDTYSKVVIMNDILFKQAVSVSFNKTFKVFQQNVVDVLESDNDMTVFWKRIKCLESDDRAKFIKKCVENIILIEDVDNIVQVRKDIISGFGKNVEGFDKLFIGDDELIPQITPEEIVLIDDPMISIKLINFKKINEDNFEYLINLINQQLVYPEEKVFQRAKKIMGIIMKGYQNKTIPNELLRFMNLNHFCDDEFFAVVCENDVEESLFTSYINSFKSDELSSKYLELINDKSIVTGISDDLIVCLVEKQFFYTPLLYFVELSKLDRISDYLKFEKSIIEACIKIKDYSVEKFLIIRNYIYFKCNNKKYKKLFFDDMPIITKAEFVAANTSLEAIDLINTAKVALDDIPLLQECIYSREYTPEEILHLFDVLFNDEVNSECIEDQDVRDVFVEQFEFEKINFKSLDEQKRSHVYKVLNKEFNVVTAADAIAITKKVGCLIPEVESVIQEESNLIKEYFEVIVLLDEMSEATLKWLEDSNEHINLAASEKICKILYDRELFVDYIVADTLRKKNMIVDETIDFDNYIYVYENVEEMFEIMSEHWDFLERLQKEGVLEELRESLLIPIFKTEQTERFFNYIFSDDVSENTKKLYLNSFGKFKSENDSKAFQVLMCEDKNMELLGDFKIYYHIHENLWSSNPTHKMLFTKSWNKHWRKELEEKEFAIIS